MGARLLLVLGLGACTEYDLKHEGEAGAGGGPNLVVDPASIDFGAVTVGDASAGAVATLTNTGDADLDLISLVLDAPVFSVTALGTHTLAAGEDTTVILTFTPATAGEVAGTLNVQSTDPDDPTVPVALSGRTPDAAPDLAFDPPVYDFGTLGPYETAALTVSLSNVGSADLTVSDLFYTATSTELSLVDASATYGALPWVLVPGEVRTLTVDYAPADDVPDEGYITALSDDPAEPEAVASQSGNGVNAADFATRCVLLDDETPYETTSNPAHVVDDHGDPDLYWYEPSGAHGLLDSADTTADFATLRAYAFAYGTETVLSGPLSFASTSTLATFAYATYTYIACDFYLQADDDPNLYTLTTGSVDDGIEVLLNGSILGYQKLSDSSGSWTLSGASRGAMNTLVVILVDDSASNRSMNELTFLRDGVVVD